LCRLVGRAVPPAHPRWAVPTVENGAGTICQQASAACPASIGALAPVRIARLDPREGYPLPRAAKDCCRRRVATDALDDRLGRTLVISATKYAQNGRLPRPAGNVVLGRERPPYLGLIVQ
jgi:hypothetical protein